MMALSNLPEVVWRTEAPARRPRLMTSVWGSLRTSFSGSTWFCSQAAIKEAVLDAAFVLESRRNLRLQQFLRNYARLNVTPFLYIRLMPLTQVTLDGASFFPTR